MSPDLIQSQKATTETQQQIKTNDCFDSSLKIEKSIFPVINILAESKVKVSLYKEITYFGQIHLCVKFSQRNNQLIG